MAYVNCERCKHPFWVKASHLDRRRFCSKNCTYHVDESIIRQSTTTNEDGWHGRSKLNPDSVLEILKRRAEGATSYQVADEFGISPSHAVGIFNGKFWKHLAK